MHYATTVDLLYKTYKTLLRIKQCDHYILGNNYNNKSKLETLQVIY